MSEDQEQRHSVVAAVETLQAERDELLELLGQVVDADCLMTAHMNHVAVIPSEVMAEIHRRTGRT